MFENVTFHDTRWFEIEDLQNEIWRDVKDYEGVYQVSNYGRVKRLEHTKYYTGGNQSAKFMTHFHYDALILKPQFDNCNYLQVHLCRSSKKKWAKIHRLVAEAFLIHYDGQTQVNHINGNKECNLISNLEWTTPSENMRHAFKTGLIKGSQRKAVLQYDLDGNYIAEYKSVTDAANAIYRNRASIIDNLRGRTTQCGGYTWKYKEDA